MEPHLTPHELSRVPSLVEHIVATPGTCGGKPRIVGHRIRVQDIAILHEDCGYLPDEVMF